MKKVNKSEQVIEMIEPLKEAKRKTIIWMAAIGKKHRILKYPIFAGTVGFIFMYNVLLYIFIGMKMHDKLARACAIMMSVILILTSTNLAAFAVDNETVEEYAEEVVEDSQESIEDIADESAAEGTEETAAEGTGETDVEGTDETDAEVTEKTDAEGTEETGAEGTEESGTEEIGGDTEESDTDEAAEEYTEETETEESAELTDEELGEDLTTVEGLDKSLMPGESIPEEEEEEELDCSVNVDGMQISVYADKGVFPKGSTISARSVSAAEEQAAQEVIDEIRDNSRNIAASYTYDISVYDEDGNEVEPDNDKGSVRVAFSMTEAADDNLQAEVYHVEGTDGGMQAEELPIVSESGAEIVVETDGFSLYTVEFTYGSYEYVMSGDSCVLLADILSSIGLSGNVSSLSDVVVSNSDLFAPIEQNGLVYIEARQPFNTAEWMKVTIGGVTYHIEVTDDNSSIPEYRIYDLNVNNTTKAITFKMYTPKASNYTVCRFDVELKAATSGTDRNTVADGWNVSYKVQCLKTDRGEIQATQNPSYMWNFTISPDKANDVYLLSADRPYVWLCIRPCYTANGMDTLAGAGGVEKFNDAVCLGKYGSLDNFNKGNDISGYTVTFNTAGKADVPSKQTISADGKSKATNVTPTNIAAGYVFEGWFTDTSCSTAYNFDTFVTKDITLYGKFKHTTHIWKYASANNVLYAYCSAGNECAYYGSSTNLTKAVSVSLTAPSYNEYDGDDKSVTVNDPQNNWKTLIGSIPSVTYQYKAESTGTYNSTDDLSKAGYYRAEVKGGDKSAYIEYEITKAACDAGTVPKARKLVYSGSYQKLITEGSTEDGEYYYSLNNLDFYTVIPSGLKAGKYTVYYKIVGDGNHSNSDTESVTVIIEEPEPEPEPEPEQDDAEPTLPTNNASLNAETGLPLSRYTTADSASAAAVIIDSNGKRIPQPYVTTQNNKAGWVSIDQTIRDYKKASRGSTKPFSVTMNGYATVDNQLLIDANKEKVDIAFVLDNNIVITVPKENKIISNQLKNTAPENVFFKVSAINTDDAKSARMNNAGLALRDIEAIGGDTTTPVVKVVCSNTVVGNGKRNMVLITFDTQKLKQYKPGDRVYLYCGSSIQGVGCSASGRVGRDGKVSFYVPMVNSYWTIGTKNLGSTIRKY